MQNIKLDTNKENNVLKEIIIFIVIIFLVVLIILNFIVYIILPISLFIAEGIKFIKNKILRKERDKDLDRIIMDLYKLSDEARAGVLIIIYELGGLLVGEVAFGPGTLIAAALVLIALYLVFRPERKQRTSISIPVKQI